MRRRPLGAIAGLDPDRVNFSAQSTEDRYRGSFHSSSPGVSTDLVSLHDFDGRTHASVWRWAMPATEPKKQLGVRGEDLGCAELERQGLRVLERNWRCRLGEPDMSVRTSISDSMPGMP